jgi:hypothetical protein
LESKRLGCDTLTTPYDAAMKAEALIYDSREVREFLQLIAGVARARNNWLELLA